MKWLTPLIGLFGLAAAVALIMGEGPRLILSTFTSAGWGVAAVSLLHFLHMAVAGLGWQALWPAQRRPPLKLFIWVLWVREAVNALLPVARIGGEVAALRLLRKSGMPLASAVGSLVAETTLSVATTFLFVLMGLLLLSWRVPQTGLWLQWGIGLFVSALILGALVALQRFGAFNLAGKIISKMAGDTFRHLDVSGRKLDRAVASFYAHPSRVLACAFWSYLGWAASAGELWLALHFLHFNAAFSDGVILEAMIMATGSAAFFVPASVGVQEGSFLLFGRMLGIPDETCLALALVRRCRDVLIMAPGLIVWQMQEGKSLFKRFAKNP